MDKGDWLRLFFKVKARANGAQNRGSLSHKRTSSLLHYLYRAAKRRHPNMTHAGFESALQLADGSGADSYIHKYMRVEDELAVASVRGMKFDGMRHCCMRAFENGWLSNENDGGRDLLLLFQLFNVIAEEETAYKTVFIWKRKKRDPLIEIESPDCHAQIEQNHADLQKHLIEHGRKVHKKNPDPWVRDILDLDR